MDYLHPVLKLKGQHIWRSEDFATSMTEQSYSKILLYTAMTIV